MPPRCSNTACERDRVPVAPRWVAREVALGDYLWCDVRCQMGLEAINLTPPNIPCLKLFVIIPVTGIIGVNLTGLND